MLKLVKFLLPIVLLAFLLRNIIQDWKTVVSQWSHFSLPPFLISFFLLLTVYPEAALSWQVVLRKLGVDIEFHKALRIWIISNTSRYIPGKIWQFVGRVELAKREAGVVRTKTLKSLLLEVFLVLAAGILVSGLALPFINIRNVSGGFLVFLLPIPLVFLHPVISNKVLDLIARFTKRDLDKLKVRFGFFDTIYSFPWFVLNFAINGIALYFLVNSLLGNLSLNLIWAFTGFYALSWVLGFITLVAPGGIGVTDVSLAYLLATYMPLPMASTIALSYRFLLTISEIVVFLVVLRIKK